MRPARALLTPESAGGSAVRLAASPTRRTPTPTRVGPRDLQQKGRQVTVEIIDLAKFHALLKDQDVSLEDIAVRCPMCGCLQSARDFYAADPEQFSSFEDVEKYIGFSCVGRWMHALPPRPEPDGKFCNWTLGGLFKTHRLEVVTPDGEHHPRFMPASPSEAQAHKEKQT